MYSFICAHNRGVRRSYAMKLNLKTVSLFAALLLTLAFSVVGCMDRSDNPGKVGPSPTVNFMPQQTGSTESSARSNAAAFDWTKNAAGIEARINQISEIAESRVVVNGNTALVAVKFAPEYRGEMTERIRQMVAAEIMAADPNIQTVAVTADDDDVDDIFDIAEDLLSGANADEIKDDINEIVRNATTLR